MKNIECYETIEETIEKWRNTIKSIKSIELYSPKLPYLIELSSKVSKDDTNKVKQTKITEKLIICSSWNYSDFIKRLNTFTIGKWFGKPTCLGSLECARYGWENVQLNQLRCRW